MICVSGKGLVMFMVTYLYTALLCFFVHLTQYFWLKLSDFSKQISVFWEAVKTIGSKHLESEAETNSLQWLRDSVRVEATTSETPFSSVCGGRSQRGKTPCMQSVNK